MLDKQRIYTHIRARWIAIWTRNQQPSHLTTRLPVRHIGKGMTISALKSLDGIIGDTIAGIERVYAAYRGGEAASGSGVMSGSGISSPRSRTPEPQHDWEARMDGGSLKSKTDLEDEIELENKNENENENENDGDTDRVHENEGEGEDANLGLGQKDGARARGIHNASSTCTATTTTTIPTTPTTTATITIPPRRARQDERTLTRVCAS